MNPVPRYFLCDPSLTNMSGHCFGYFEPVRDVLQRRGHQAFIIGNMNLDANLSRDADVVPAFTYWCDERNVGQSENLSFDANADAIRDAHEAALVRNLVELDLLYRFDSTDVIVINTLRHWAVGGVEKWLSLKGLDKAPSISLIMLFSSEPDLGKSIPAARHYKEAFDSLLKLARPDKIRVFADSDSLIDEYLQLSRLSVQLAPFPQKIRARSASQCKNAIRLGYIGEARQHKGYHLLPFLIESLNQSDLKDIVCFEVQCYIGDARQSFYAPATAMLARAANVSLYSGILNDDEYEALLDRVDVFLLPYGLAHYHRQTSAIFHAAISRDCPVVTSRGTWMAKKVKEIGGGALCNPDDYLSLLEATTSICRNVDSYRTAAAVAGVRWRAYNNVDMWLQRVLGIAE